MKQLITGMIVLMLSGCVSLTSLKNVYDSYKAKDEPQEEVVPDEPVKSSDKDQVLALEWDYSVDVHKMFLHYTGQNNPKDFLKIIADLPIDFQVMSYNDQGATVSIPTSDPTGNLAGEGDRHSMAYRRLVFCSFKNGKLIQLEDQNHNHNEHIKLSYPLADQIMVVHTRFNGLVSRTLLTEVNHD